MQPNFIIIGAAKSGTTALYHYLRQHPEIYMSPVKEPRHFAFDPQELNFAGPGDAELHRSSILDPAQYEALFKGANATHKALGEASPVYMCSPKAADRIAKKLPQVKLIAILRHPVDRAYSHYMHLIRDNVEPITEFEQALAAEDERVDKNWEYRWRYKALGFYSQQLERFFNLFDRRQIKIYLYEEFDKQPQQVLRDIYQFLGVDQDFVAEVGVRYNASGVPRIKLVHSFLTKLQKVTQKELNEISAGSKSLSRNTSPDSSSTGKFKLVEKARRAGIALKNGNLVKTKLDEALRVKLLAEYRDDILATQQLVQRDLSDWLR
jgi:hypothetical protein